MNAQAYATINQCTPHGAIYQMTLGNNLLETTVYDPARLQPVSMMAGGLTLGYTYAPAGLSAFNNGNVQSQTIQAGAANWTQTYSYDALNRLLSVQENGATPWSQNYQYDAYGNRSVSGQTTGVLGGIGGGTPQGVNWYASNNQASDPSHPWTYDGSGNLQQIPASSENNVSTLQQNFTYDAESRQLTATINGVQTSYLYDGDGRRVSKTQAGQTTTYVYDATGNLAAEYGLGGGSLCGAPTCYQTEDALGSLRMTTDSNNPPQTVRRYDYLPFGGELLAGTNGRTTVQGYVLAGDGSEPKFTGQYRDYETGLDYFGARYMSSAQGRFTSVDPAFESEILEYPQTWNRYSYVYNNPLRLTDPDGRCPNCVAAAVGAGIGGLAEGGINLFSQLSSNGWDIHQVSWSEVGANAAGGAVAGGLAGFTLGGSLVADVLVGGAANMAGGIVNRTIQSAAGDGTVDPLGGNDVATDFVAGAAGGAIGHGVATLAADVTHTPIVGPEPRPGRNSERDRPPITCGGRRSRTQR